MVTTTMTLTFNPIVPPWTRRVTAWQSKSPAPSRRSYTPDSATFDDNSDDPNDVEVAYCLRATATYTDNIDSDQDAGETGVQLEEDAHGTHDAPGPDEPILPMPLPKFEN